MSDKKKRKLNARNYYCLLEAGDGQPAVELLEGKKHIYQSKWSTGQLLCSRIPETNEKN